MFVDFMMASTALLVVIGLAIFAGILAVFVTLKAVVFAKISLSLAIAALINVYSPILGGGFFGFVIWAAIVLGIVFVLSLSNRFNCAFQFFSTSVISYLACIFLIYALGGSVVQLITKQPFESSLASEIVIKIICLVASLSALKATFETCGKINIFENKILINIERAICSVFYGFGIYFFVASTNNIFGISSLVEDLVVIGGMALSFVLDVKLIGDEM